MNKGIRKVVLAYSGGLDTSVIIRWLIEKYNCEVIAFIADLGQNEDLGAIEQKAIKTGAGKAVVEDVREEFVRDYIFPALKANAIYEGMYLMGTSLARPLIARKQIEVALREGADAVAHGATGKGNDQVRFELTYASLEPSIKVVAPWREWEFSSRSELVEYAGKHGIPVPVTKEKPYSCDANLFHISYEGGVLEDPWAAYSDDMFTLTVSPEKAPDSPQFLEIDFVRGTPARVNGQSMSPAQLLTELNRLGGANGIGRIDMVENRYIGIKSRGVYETPGGTILHVAHRAVESITMDREVMHLRDSLVSRYAELVYYGYWFSPEMRMIQSAIDTSQENVTGTARVKLYKGNCTVAGRRSSVSLYRPEIATFEKGASFNPKDAEGFIKINAMRLKLRNG